MWIISRNKSSKKYLRILKKKKKIEIKPSILKEQMYIFLNCTIVNPSFDSQNKDYLNTPPGKFGSSCVVSDKFIEKLARIKSRCCRRMFQPMVCACGS